MSDIQLGSGLINSALPFHHTAFKISSRETSTSSEYLQRIKRGSVSPFRCLFLCLLKELKVLEWCPVWSLWSPLSYPWQILSLTYHRFCPSYIIERDKALSPDEVFSPFVRFSWPAWMLLLPSRACSSYMKSKSFLSNSLSLTCERSEIPSTLEEKLVQ